VARASDNDDDERRRQGGKEAGPTRFTLAGSFTSIQGHGTVGSSSPCRVSVVRRPLAFGVGARREITNDKDIETRRTQLC